MQSLVSTALLIPTLPMRRSLIVGLPSVLLKSAYLDKSACGSKSIASTLLFLRARAVAILKAVVVLPTPPFWLATEMILHIIFTSVKMVNLLILTTHYVSSDILPVTCGLGQGQEYFHSYQYPFW